jgi:hypothetical protein
MFSIMSEFRMGVPGLMNDRLALQGEGGVSKKIGKPRRSPVRLSGMVLRVLRILAVAQERIHQPVPNKQPAHN